MLCIKSIFNTCVFPFECWRRLEIWCKDESHSCTSFDIMNNCTDLCLALDGEVGHNSSSFWNGFIQAFQFTQVPRDKLSMTQCDFFGLRGNKCYQTESKLDLELPTPLPLMIHLSNSTSTNMPQETPLL